MGDYSFYEAGMLNKMVNVSLMFIDTGQFSAAASGTLKEFRVVAHMATGWGYTSIAADIMYGYVKLEQLNK